MASDKKSHKGNLKNKAPRTKSNIFSGIREELNHVTWPSRQETIQLTTTVITISLIVALFVGIIDLSLAKVLAILSTR